MSQKRGQITVYIIIGIIALISVSIFFYMRGVKIEAPEEYKPTIEEVPVEAAPIREFVETCLRVVAEDGLKKVGDYGGYTSFENMAASLNPFNPTMAEAVQFSPGSDLRIPYWWYMSSPNDCEKSGICRFASKRPNIYRLQDGITIEEQLDEYVNENLKLCLRDFVDLVDLEFEISEIDEVDTKTVVTQKSVAFHTQYPLVAEKAGVSYQINEYFVDIPLRLKEVYDLATNITNAQIKYFFLESYIKNTIALFSRVDKDALPPFSGSGIDSDGGVTWMKMNVEKQLMQILMSYISMIQVVDSKEHRLILFHPDDPYDKGKMALYNFAANAPVLEPHPDLEVKFNYLDWWKPYFNLNCNEQLCGPEAVSGVISIAFFLQRYHFNYDISLPVLVDIVDPEAFRGAGWSFKFFLEANMRDNNRIVEGAELLPEAADIGGGSMLCDENKRNSPEVTLTVTDSVTGLEVPDVMVNFECGNEECNMGRTNEAGELILKYPVCVGGLVKVSKDEYLGSAGLLNTMGKDPIDLRIIMNPLLEKDIRVMKYPVRKNIFGMFGLELTAEGGFVVPGENQTGDNGETVNATDGEEEFETPSGSGWQLVTPPIPVPLALEEEAAIVLTRRGEIGEDPFVAMVDYTGDRTLDDHSKDIPIVPGYYDIMINMNTRKIFSIPASERCEGGFLGIAESCSTFERMDFGPEEPFASGGLELKNVYLSAIDISRNDQIVFYAFSIALDDTQESWRRHEDIEMISKIPDYSAMYRSLVLPTYEKYDEIGMRDEPFVLNITQS